MDRFGVRERVAAGVATGVTPAGDNVECVSCLIAAIKVTAIIPVMITACQSVDFLRASFRRRVKESLF